jgi:hypothetical protein
MSGEGNSAVGLYPRGNYVYQYHLLYNNSAFCPQSELSVSCDFESKRLLFP